MVQNYRTSLTIIVFYVLQDIPSRSRSRSRSVLELFRPCAGHFGIYAAVLLESFFDAEYCFQVSLEDPRDDDCQRWTLIKPNKLTSWTYEIVNAECKNNVMLKDQGHPENWLVSCSFPVHNDPCKIPVSDAHLSAFMLPS